MTEIKPELKLTYLEGSNPKHYALNVKIDGQMADPYLMTNNDNGNMVNPNNHFVVAVEMVEMDQGSDELNINLGQITFDNEESLVEVRLKQNNDLVGTGSIRVKEAQQESRPIKESL